MDTMPMIKVGMEVLVEHHGWQGVYNAEPDAIETTQPRTVRPDEVMAIRFGERVIWRRPSQQAALALPPDEDVAKLLDAYLAAYADSRKDTDEARENYFATRKALADGRKRQLAALPPVEADTGCPDDCPDCAEVDAMFNEPREADTMPTIEVGDVLVFADNVTLLIGDHAASHWNNVVYANQTIAAIIRGPVIWRWPSP